MNLLRLLVILVVLVALALFLLRVVRPARPRARSGAGGPTVVPGSVVPDPEQAGLPRVAGHGYDEAEVVALLDQVYALADTASGRREALDLVRGTRFHVARGGGYDPRSVDERVDAIVRALESGRELPPRPDQR